MDQADGYLGEGESALLVGDGRSGSAEDGDLGAGDGLERVVHHHAGEAGLGRISGHESGFGEASGQAIEAFDGGGDDVGGDAGGEAEGEGHAGSAVESGGTGECRSAVEVAAALFDLEAHGDARHGVAVGVEHEGLEGHGQRPADGASLVVAHRHDDLGGFTSQAGGAELELAGGAEGGDGDALGAGAGGVAQGEEGAGLAVGVGVELEGAARRIARLGGERATVAADPERDRLSGHGIAGGIEDGDHQGLGQGRGEGAELAVAGDDFEMPAEGRLVAHGDAIGAGVASGVEGDDVESVVAGL